MNTKGSCIYVSESKNVHMVNNVISNCNTYGIAAFDKTKSITINNNYISTIINSYPITGDTYQVVAGIDFNKFTSKYSVKNNIVVGV